MCAQTASYSCTKNGKPSTCTKCVAWKSNGRCMRKEAVNDTLSKVTLYYTYADPLCSRKFSPIPIPCTSCECMETGGLDTCTVCGSCSDDKKQNTCTNPGSEQVACSNPACNTPTYDVGDNKKCEETKENSIKLNRPFVIGDAYNPLSTDRDWLQGKEGYYVGGDPMSKDSEKSNCRSQEFNVSELGLIGVDASKITEVLSCTLSSGDTYGQDWLSGSGTYGGVYKTICGNHSQSCSVTGKKKVTITMCTKYHTYSCSTPTSSGVIDYDDWGIASLKLKYKIKTSD